MRIANATTVAFLQLLLMFAFVTAGQCVERSGKLEPGDYVQSVESGGLKRTFLVHIPRHLDSRPALMVVFHGGGGTSVTTANRTRMSTVADEGNFVAVYPQGFRKEWNFGPGAKSNQDDVAFIRRMLDYLADELNVDQSRIYMAGMSEGGHMTERLTYEMPEKIASAGIVCALGQSTLYRMHRCTRPEVPVVLMFGTADPHNPWNGGTTAINGIAIMSAPDTVDSWTRADECRRPEKTALPNINTNDGSRVELEYYRGNRNNDVAFYKIINGGHAWPGGPKMPASLVGNTNEDINGSLCIWQFAMMHPKR